MAAPRKISDADYQRLLLIALERRKAKRLPTDAQLAAQLGCTVRGVQDAMRRLLLCVTTVSGEIDYGTIGSLSLPSGAAPHAPDLQIRARAKPPKRG